MERVGAQLHHCAKGRACFMAESLRPMRFRFAQQMQAKERVGTRKTGQVVGREAVAQFCFKFEQA
jgi:hypothetical protein